MQNQTENQIILVDKPAGISSFGVVAKVRGYLKATYGHKIKVGHTGTLDPFATGLLILLTGKMTKKSNEFLKKDKVYEATLKLGYTSTTGDPEGEITNTSDSIPTLKNVQTIASSFIGEIEQKVPTFSAVKINGERAYKLARKGVDFETPTRKVTIYNIEILKYEIKYLLSCIKRHLYPHSRRRHWRKTRYWRLSHRSSPYQNRRLLRHRRPPTLPLHTRIIIKT